MGIAKLRIRSLFLLLFFLLCIDALIFVNSFGRPLQSDDFRNASQLAMPFSDYYNPPLYIICLKLLFKYFHLAGRSLRLFNFFCFFVNLSLIYFLGGQISQNKPAAVLGCILFASSPLAIQGAFILDVDLTVLPIFLTLFVLYFCFAYDNLGLKNCFLLGSLFFLCLFAKFSTPWALIPAALIFYWLKRKTVYGLRNTFLIGVIGLGLFALIWGAFARYYRLSFWHFFAGSGFSLWFYRNLYFSLDEYLKYLLRIIVWGGPVLLLILLAAVRRTKDYFYRRNIAALDFCLIYIGMAFLGYFFVGRHAHRFLKYLYPVLPVAAAAIADFITELKFQFDKKTLLVLGVFMPIILIYNTFVSGDVIYILEHTIRSAVVFAPAKLPGLIGNFVLRLFSYLLFILLVHIVLRSLNQRWNFLKAVSLSILVVGVCAHLSLNLLQARADYFTTYYYGRDIEEMRRLGRLFTALKEKYPQGIIIGPGDVFGEVTVADRLQDQALGFDADDPRTLLQTITDENVVCLSYSITWNKISTFRNVLLREEIQQALRDQYSLRQLGTFSVWVKKGKEVI